jgi:hypothetical protein
VVQAVGMVGVEPGVPRNLVVEAVAAVGRAQAGVLQHVVAEVAAAVGMVSPGGIQSLVVETAADRLDMVQPG